jgi:uncharacterized protein
VLRDLAGFDQHVASRLTRIELRRLALGEDALEAADRLLDGVALVPPDDALLAASETLLPATVATLDAIHLATALRLAAEGMLDTVMTYDRRLADGAEQHGLRVVPEWQSRSPSRSRPWPFQRRSSG